VPLQTVAVDATHVMGTTQAFAATVFAAYGKATEVPADAAGAPTCDTGDAGDAGDAGGAADALDAGAE
jgi:hypothetical protein